MVSFVDYFAHFTILFLKALSYCWVISNWTRCQLGSSSIRSGGCRQTQPEPCLLFTSSLISHSELKKRIFFKVYLHKCYILSLSMNLCWDSILFRHGWIKLVVVVDNCWKSAWVSAYFIFGMSCWLNCNIVFTYPAEPPDAVEITALSDYAH